MTFRLYTLPPGAPFLPSLADALLSGRLIPGFPGADPLALADATIYVPTRRSAAEFGRALVAASGGRSLVLPRIAPLGAFEPDSARERLAFDPRAVNLEAVGELTRRMALARLVGAWGEALKGAIRRVDSDGRLAQDPNEAPLVANTPAQAFALAGDLAALIDDMIIEGVAWSELDRLVAEPYDPYWRITLDFLKIAIHAWPAWLDEHALTDRAAQAADAVDREIASLESGARAGPTIIAGSTGTNRATARLIGAIAGSPQGAVVLPGLDLALDEAAWEMLGEGGENEGGVAGHPQAALRRLLVRIGASRDDVTTLSEAPPPLLKRSFFLSEALRPAESTDRWQDRDPALAREALAGLSLVEAENETEEAIALAIALREALETPGRRAALITPDPGIARRVAAELARWGLEVENSAGRALGDTEVGALTRLTLAAALDFAPAPIAALLRHPALRLRREPTRFTAGARALELGVLRAILPPAGLADLDAAFEAAHRAGEDRHAPRALKSALAEASEARELMQDLTAALAPLRAAGRAPLSQFVAALRGALVELTSPEPLAGVEGGEALEDLLDEWADSATDGFDCTLGDFVALADQLLMAERAPERGGGHPRLAILGLLEARLLDFDLTLLAGLDETVWPPAAETDAFLNRPMRADLKLSPPERRIGQTAHDFVAALGAREAVLSRARKRGGSPTVESRFLQRIGAFGGDEARAAMRRRGDRYVALARALDHAEATPALKPPHPKPPADWRPRQLSVTRIETLRRDPYAIYAERILKLQPLPPIGAAIGPREIGDVWHAALEAFSTTAPHDETAEAARTRLITIATKEFAPLCADRRFRATRWPRILKGFETFLEFDRAHRAAAQQIWFECDGKFEWLLPDGAPFALTARADRIERLISGAAVIVDYKTGAPPGAKEVEVGFAPQLTLQAAMLARGAFRGPPAMATELAYYLKLGGAEGGKEHPISFKDKLFSEVAEAHFVGMQKIVAIYADATSEYLSRPFAKYVARGEDYDHLARVKEWSATGGAPEGGDVA